MQNDLIQKMAAQNTIKLPESKIEFCGNEELKNTFIDHPEPKARLSTEDSITTLQYDNGFFLKMYRKIDPTTNPDLEITRHLTEKVMFPNIAPFAGSIEWKFKDDSIALGMLQKLAENHGDGYNFMLTRVNNFIERVLAGNRDLINTTELSGTPTEPTGFDQLPEEVQVLLGATASEQARQIGIRTGEMHLALAAAKNNKDFATEAFSLHYQRSLFSSMQSLVRETTENKNVNSLKIPENLKNDLNELICRRNELLAVLKRIYAKKLDVIKIRIHGNLHLEQIIFTGRDVMINDFGGDPVRSFSDRRLKRSPLRDVASMVRSFRNVAFDGFYKSTHIQEDEMQALAPFARLWAHYVTGFFMKAYLETVEGSEFIPADKKDLQMMLDTFMLEKSLLDLNFELNNKPARMVVPLRVIRSILNSRKAETAI